MARPSGPMNVDEATRTSDRARGHAGREDAELALAIVHADDPSRVGEIVFAPKRASAMLGRAEGDGRLVPVRQRPGRILQMPPLDSPFLSRDQLRVSRTGERTLGIENVGKCALHDATGREVTSLAIEPGQAFALGQSLVLLCVERPATLDAPRTPPTCETPFGAADAVGLVGESPVAWALRDTLAFVAGRSAHVLVFGPSGSGKEIAAQAIHRLSSRRARPLVSRNASTLPAGLIEAELFGNVANYPSHGMPERPGLVGEAHGSTLFLDEIGELSEDLSTRLLRLLDQDGEYQRLGDARKRTANVRVLGATNRPPSALRSDLVARFKLRLTLAGLDPRREDVPLIARHLMSRVGAEDADVAQRFFREGRPDAQNLRLAPDLVLRLVTHDYRTHVRELDALLWLALSSSKGDVLALTPDVLAELSGGEPADAQAAKGVPSADDVRAALARADGIQEKAWRDLGLANRHVLKRLLKKYGLGAAER